MFKITTLILFIIEITQVYYNPQEVLLLISEVYQVYNDNNQ